MRRQTRNVIYTKDTSLNPLKLQKFNLCIKYSLITPPGSIPPIPFMNGRTTPDKTDT